MPETKWGKYFQLLKIIAYLLKIPVVQESWEMGSLNQTISDLVFL
jgi:hypothetical protein